MIRYGALPVAAHTRMKAQYASRRGMWNASQNVIFSGRSRIQYLSEYHQYPGRHLIGRDFIEVHPFLSTLLQHVWREFVARREPG